MTPPETSLVSKQQQFSHPPQAVPPTDLVQESKLTESILHSYQVLDKKIEDQNQYLQDKLNRQVYLQEESMLQFREIKEQIQQSVQQGQSLQT